MIRSSEQNRRMWAMLADISRQVPWVVNGHSCTLDKEDWKEIMTAGLTKHQRIAQGIDGGWVMLGTKTSNKPKEWMTELIELMFAFGAEREVEWSDPTIVPLSAYSEAA